MKHYFIAALLTLSATAQAENIKLDKVLSVSDYLYTMRDKPAVTIVLGGTEINFVRITMLRQDIKQGTKAESSNEIPFSISATWNSQMFMYENGYKFKSTYSVEISKLDIKNKQAIIKLDFCLQNTTRTDYICTTGSDIIVSGKYFYNLTDTPKQ